MSELENRERFAFRGTHVGGDGNRYKIWEAIGPDHTEELSGKFFIEKLVKDSESIIRKDGPLFDARLVAIEAIQQVTLGAWPGEKAE
ncbi:MAG: hypothetical protein WCS37_09205 [Chloroflexota bacterium]|nr:hypothetical protein [Chloroflexota bacterium]